MLEELLYKFATDDTVVSLHLDTSLSLANPVVTPIGATAYRHDDGSEGTRVASVRGHLNNITAYDRKRVLQWMDAESAELEPLGSAAYSIAEEAWSSHILTIEGVEAHGDEKGTGLALALLGATIEHLSAGRNLTVVIEPCPYYHWELTPYEARKGRKKLHDHWAKLGFVRASPRSKYMVMVAEDYEFPASALAAN